MKKYVTFMLAAFLFFALTGCSPAVESAAQPDPNILYENQRHGFSLVLPASWEDEYAVEEEEQYIAFYHLETTQELEGMGRLFDIHVFSRERWESEGLEMAEMINLRPIYEDDDVVFALAYPTDIQISLTNDELRVEYKKMEGEINSIIDSFSKKEGDIYEDI